MDGDAVLVNVDDPGAPDVRTLLRRHLSFACEITPAEHVHALDVEALSDPAVTFFSARREGLLLGVGALKQLDPVQGELKSMHTVETARRQGVGRRARCRCGTRGYEAVSLETGTEDAFGPARRLYQRVGFVACPPFAQYTVNPYSTCMRIRLGTGGRR